MTKPEKLPQDRADATRELSQSIGEVSRLWRLQMNQRLKPFGLNLSMRQVLLQLHRNPAGLMQRDLAHKLGIEGATLVRLLDQLEEKKWIQRITASDDKRCKHAILTPKATEQIRIIEELSNELRDTMMRALSPHEIAMCVTVMQRIKGNLEE